MRFVIIGAGRVGLRTARIVAEEGHEVIIIERDQRMVERARTEGFDVIEGDGSDNDVLERAGLDRTDAVAGLTGNMNVNFAACMVAKHYGCRTVLRIDADYREDIYREYAEDVDEIIYPERLGAIGAKNALLGGDSNVIGDVTARLQLAAVTISAGAASIGQHVEKVELPPEARIYAHGRQGERLTIPLPGTIIEPNDTVAFIAERDAFDDVFAVLLGDEPVSAD